MTAPIAAPTQATRINARHGAVVAGHPLATAAAIATLGAGGNVVDAALTAAAVLAVVCPYATSLGGDVTILLNDATTGSAAGSAGGGAGLVGLNGTGRAPAAASPAAFAGGLPRSGIRAVTVPGFVAGLADAGERFGTRPLSALLQPAIRCAAGGFPVHPTLARNIAMRAELLRGDAAAAAIFLDDGEPPAVGATLRQADLAATLQEVADQGPRAFYEGSTAQRLIAAVKSHDGLLSGADLAVHESLWQTALLAPFHGHSIVAMPPNSYGLTLLLQLLALERDGIAAAAPATAAFARHGLNARNKAYGMAADLIADPDDTAAGAAALLDSVVAAGPRRAAPPHAPRAPRPPEIIDGGTTGVVVMDAAGNAVCLLQSVSAPFGAGIVAAGTGIVLNNRMRGFTTNRDRPNCVGPRRRPAHTLSPCLVMDDGRPVMAIATPGATGQTSTIAQLLAAVLAGGADLADAVAAPRWSVDLDGRPIIEDGFAAAARAALAADAADWRVMPTGWQTFGSIKAVQATADGLIGVADGRRAATAAGW